jgi:hypothetical protein
MKSVLIYFSGFHEQLIFKRFFNPCRMTVANKIERFSTKKTSNKKLTKTNEEGRGFQENRTVFDEIKQFFDKIM